MNYYDPNAQPPSQWPPQQPGQPWQSQPGPWPPPQPMQPPYTQPYAPPGQWPPMQPPPRRRRPRLWLWIVGAIVVISLCSTMLGNAISQNSAAQPTVPSLLPLAQTPTSVVIHYPPKTEADLHGLAAKGDANAVQGFHSESTGLVGICPQPKRFVVVSPAITGQQLAEDLLAYFYGQQLDSPCGSMVLAYHNQSEANDVYTAALMRFTATDASGQINTDPNATGLKYTLTIDIGSFNAPQESTVTY